MATESSGLPDINRICQDVECVECPAVFKVFPCPGFKNWAYASLCLRYMKTGVDKFSNSLSNKLHNELNSALLKAESCPFCTALPAFTNRVDKKECIRDSCWPLKNKLIEQGSMHINHIDINALEATPWEIAKLFFPPHLRTSEKPEEADCSALLAFFLTYKECVECRTEVEQVKENRNRLMHSATMTITEEQLQEYGESCKMLLEKIDHPESEKDRQNSIDCINKILSNSIKIDMREVGDAALKQHFQHVQGDIKGQRLFLENVDITKKERSEAMERLKQMEGNLKKTHLILSIFEADDDMKRVNELSKLVQEERSYINKRYNKIQDCKRQKREDLCRCHGQAFVYNSDNLHKQIKKIIDVNTPTIYKPTTEEETFPLACVLENCYCTHFNDLLWKLAETAGNNVLKEYGHVFSSVHFNEEELNKSIEIGVLDSLETFSDRQQELFFASIYFNTKMSSYGVNTIISNASIDRLEEITKLISRSNSSEAKRRSEAILKRERSRNDTDTGAKSSTDDEVSRNDRTSVLYRRESVVQYLRESEINQTNAYIDTGELHQISVDGQTITQNASNQGRMDKGLSENLRLTKIEIMQYSKFISLQSLERLQIMNFSLVPVLSISLNLRTINLDNVTFMHKTWQQVFSDISKMTQLTDLYMKYLKCSTHTRSEDLAIPPDGYRRSDLRICTPGMSENNPLLKWVDIQENTISDCLVCRTPFKKPICVPCYKVSSPPITTLEEQDICSIQ